MRDRLPPELEALLEAERRAPAPSAAAQARMGRRLEATLGLGAVLAVAATASKASAATSVAGKTIALKLVLGAVGAVLVVGGGSYIALHKNRPRASLAAPVVSVAPPPLAEPLQFAPTPIEAPAQPPPHLRLRVHPDGLASEQAYIEEARAALIGGAPERAIQLLAQHEHRFPSGQLAEVRDSLRIQALVSTHEVDAAKTRADEFRRRFPHSLFLPAVDASLAARP